jgi:hypothetical protein
MLIIRSNLRLLVSIVSVHHNPSIVTDTHTVLHVVSLHVHEKPCLSEVPLVAGRDPAPFSDSRRPGMRLYGSLQQNCHASIISLFVENCHRHMLVLVEKRK